MKEEGYKTNRPTIIGFNWQDILKINVGVIFNAVIYNVVVVKIAKDLGTIVYPFSAVWIIAITLALGMVGTTLLIIELSINKVEAVQ